MTINCAHHCATDTFYRYFYCEIQPKNVIIKFFCNTRHYFYHIYNYFPCLKMGSKALWIIEIITDLERTSSERKGVKPSLMHTMQAYSKWAWIMMTIISIHCIHLANKITLRQFPRCSENSKKHLDSYNSKL